MDKIPHVAIIFEEGHDRLNEVAQDFINDVTCDELDLRSESRPGMGPMACVEWYIPTALFLFLGKSYFDSFLKEMGQDHYRLLKIGLTNLWNKLFGKDKVIKYTLIGTAGKLTQNYKYSLEFSIIAELKERQTFKFLFEESISKSEFSERVDLILNLLNSIHTAPEKIQDYIIFNDNAISTGSIVLIGYDPTSQKLINLDPREKHKPDLAP